MTAQPHRHHGPVARRKGMRPAGGWLITYADIMTILVCFFVMIISYSIKDQVKMEVVAGSMRDAFGVAEERRYAGDIKLEGTPEERQPGNIRPSPMPTASGIAETLTARPAAGADSADGAYEYSNADRKRFEVTKAALAAAVEANPLLKDASEAITITLVEDGLQVVLVDTEGVPMFALGSAAPTLRAKALLEEVAKALAPLANRLIIEGHADATGAGAYSPFDLTAARANAARRILEEAGMPVDRIAGVMGRGAATPLYPEDPSAAGNRRIEITLERAAPLLPPERAL
ncbi:MAG: flagellar motor protein MotB [Parvularculaceae bacterium]